MIAEYVSIWDGDEVRSACKIDLGQSPPQVFDIDSVDLEEGYELCEREYIELPDGTQIDTFLNLDNEELCENGRYEH